jgi:DNA-binding transcriptional LysR family regulator
MIPKLEMLIALAQEQHFGRAAESLGITQPTLSSGIKQLEDHLGVKLVQRGARFGGLTPEGLRALEMARQIVGDMRRLREEMRFTRHGLSGQVRLAVIPTALTWAAWLVARFVEAHPAVGFSVRSASSREILELVDNLEVDAGVTYLDNEPLGHHASAPLYRESYTLVCNNWHPLAHAKKVGWADVAGLKLCLLTPNMQNRRIIDRNVLDTGQTATASVEANSTVALVAMVESGDWVTVLPTDLAAFLAKGHGLSVVPIEGGSQAYSVGLVSQHQEPQTPVLRALFETAARLKAPGV